MDHSEQSGDLSPKKLTSAQALASYGRPGSPPPELLVYQTKFSNFVCEWHFSARKPNECAMGQRNLISKRRQISMRMHGHKLMIATFNWQLRSWRRPACGQEEERRRQPLHHERRDVRFRSRVGKDRVKQCKNLCIRKRSTPGER